MRYAHNFIRTKKSVAILVLIFLITSSTVSTTTAVEQNTEEKIELKQSILNFNDLITQLKDFLNDLLERLNQLLKPETEQIDETPPEELSEEPQDDPELPPSEQPPGDEEQTTSNSPPNKPEMPYNSEELYLTISVDSMSRSINPETPHYLNLSTSTTDPNDNSLKYVWDFNGDGLIDVIQNNGGNFYESGEIASTSYSWLYAGTYEVKVMAIDEHGAESEWSDSRSIKVKDLSKPPQNIPIVYPPSTPERCFAISENTPVPTGFLSTLPPTWKTYGEPGNQIQFDWGDGSKSPWYDTDKIEGVVYAGRRWFEVGEFEIRARQKNYLGDISWWSGYTIVNVFDGSVNETII